MNYLLIGIVFVVALLIAFAIYESRLIFETKEEIAAFDGMKYKVHSSFKDSKLAANTMAEIYSRGKILMIHLKKKYLHGTGEKAHITKTLLNRFKKYNIYENGINSSDTSYTENKEKLVLCLRDKKDAKLHNTEILTFVFFHELAHMAIDTIDDTEHGPWFWTVFKFLLTEASLSGALTPVDYKLQPQRYCGLNVGYNPYFDPNIPNL